MSLKARLNILESSLMHVEKPIVIILGDDRQGKRPDYFVNANDKTRYPADFDFDQLQGEKIYWITAEFND